MCNNFYSLFVSVLFGTIPVRYLTQTGTDLVFLLENEFLMSFLKWSRFSYVPFLESEWESYIFRETCIVIWLNMLFSITNQNLPSPSKWSYLGSLLPPRIKIMENHPPKNSFSHPPSLQAAAIDIHVTTAVCLKIHKL